MQQFHLAYWDLGPDDEVEIVVRCIGAIFYLQWDPTELITAPHLQQSYFESIKILKSDDDDDYDDQRAAAEMLRCPFNSLMSDMAPTPPKTPPFSLHSYINPQCTVLKATVGNDGAGVQIISPCRLEGGGLGPIPIGKTLKSLQKLELEKWVPNWYTSGEVELAQSTEHKLHPLLRPPSKVLVDGGQTACFFKGFGLGIQATIRELEAYRKLHASFIPSNIRICRLHGLICDSVDRSTPVIGILLRYIEPFNPPTIPSTLPYLVHNFNLETRQLWAKELETTVHKLHLAGCVWGDAKPDNVLVDNENKVWLIDMGGGYTRGWTSKESEGTFEGDLDALEKIKMWLLADGMEDT